MNAPAKTIVLMYHGITSKDFPAPEGREAGAELYDVSAENFREQMEFLKNHGYAVATLEGGGQVNSADMAKVILTFDDGELNLFKNTFGLLRQLGFPAYFFVTVNRIGKKGYMGWEELKELRDCGITIGSHGLNHQLLTNLKDKTINQELADSKEILERNLKINIEYFSVPRGFYDQNIIRLAKGAGYKKIFVSRLVNRLMDGCVARVAIRHDWTLTRFELALAGQMPLEERTFEGLKGMTKKILGHSGYDRLRRLLLRAGK